MKTVYFVRHGESEANTNDLLIGPTAPLTEKGREQARFIAERATKLPIDAVVASNMARAQETAAIICEQISKQYDVSELFRERRWPKSVQGLDRTEDATIAKLREWYKTFYEPDTRVEDGENFADLKQRAGEALHYLEERPEKNILVATHGFFVRMVLARVLLGGSLTPEEFFSIAAAVRTENTGISVLQYYAEEAERVDMYPHKGWITRVWNDHAHLG